jgi:hypothetical protein
MPRPRNPSRARLLAKAGFVAPPPPALARVITPVSTGINPYVFARPPRRPARPGARSGGKQSRATERIPGGDCSVASRFLAMTPLAKVPLTPRSRPLARLSGASSAPPDIVLQGDRRRYGQRAAELASRALADAPYGRQEASRSRRPIWRAARQFDARRLATCRDSLPPSCPAFFLQFAFFRASETKTPPDAPSSGAALGTAMKVRLA